MSEFALVSYEPKHQPAFKALNLEWLVEFKLLEDRDLIALDNPQSILDDGGVIFIALSGDDVVGSSAVIIDHGQYELAKMAVAKSHRGKGLSKMLLKKCIQFATKDGAEKIILYSNHQLTTAIELYEKSGFKHIALENSPFATADVKMELRLK